MKPEGREIKFRAWDKTDKRMIVHEQDFIPVKVTSMGVLRLNPHHEEAFWEFMPEERFELMQFTGLKDKNGKEVYEGDILCNPNQLKGIVVYYDAGFHLEVQRKNGDVWYMPLNSGMLHNKEFIGNIYET